MNELKWTSTKHQLPKFGQTVTVKWKPERDASCIGRGFCQRATFAKSGKPTGKPFWIVDSKIGGIRANVTHWLDDNDLFALKVKLKPSTKPDA